ncbi:30S ribosome-binding factor RbfA [Citroniella saccharovorans]|uniref:Ribosome-binding factor A n=1 Tax=Citroniella saccharovorans TaxID=2053367 RepID=A0AAW9MU84_9FIRM|nr:30S ribosome-binding factor RbfA [Citroniella saccharovorans]MEB3429631.1 30S ribosome-binding factor RbfA [Citroniella saccharovorans]
MNNRRIQRISQEIKKIISNLLIDGIKDPRISKMTSITSVKVSNDLSYADIYISVLGRESEKEESLDGLKKAKGYIKKEIGSKIDLRHVPELRFHLDDTLDHGMKIDEILRQIKEENLD